MMPTILREGGFAVMIFTRDHPPAHVHVLKAGGAVKVSLLTLCVSAMRGISRITRSARPKTWCSGTRIA
jgi:hypothetical protein